MAYYTFKVSHPSCLCNQVEVVADNVKEATRKATAEAVHMLGFPADQLTLTVAAIESDMFGVETDSN